MSESNQPIVVLLVDDDYQVTSFMIQVLEKDAAYVILTANSGKTALEIAQASPELHVVVTEIELSGEMKGFELCTRIRQHHPSVKIVLTSAGGVSQAGTYTDLPVVAKPFLAREFAAVVRDAAGGKTGSATLSGPAF